MQITADISKFVKLFNATSPLFLMYFQDQLLVLCHFWFPRLEKMFHLKCFFSKMRWRNNAYLCGNVLANSWQQFHVQLFCIPFAIKKFSFRGSLFKRILAWEGGTSKTWYQTKIVPLLFIFHLTQLIQGCESFDFT